MRYLVLIRPLGNGEGGAGPVKRTGNAWAVVEAETPVHAAGQLRIEAKTDDKVYVVPLDDKELLPIYAQVGWRE